MKTSPLRDISTNYMQLKKYELRLCYAPSTWCIKFYKTWFHLEVEYGLYPFLVNLENNLSGYKKNMWGQGLGEGEGTAVGMQNK